MWNKLSMADKAKYIKLGIQNNITDINTIRDTYNSYGGKVNKYDGYSQSTQQMNYGTRIDPLGQFHYYRTTPAYISPLRKEKLPIYQNINNNISKVKDNNTRQIVNAKVTANGDIVDENNNILSNVQLPYTIDNENNFHIDLPSILKEGNKKQTVLDSLLNSFVAVGDFINDEIAMNKNNNRVKNISKVPQRQFFNTPVKQVIGDLNTAGDFIMPFVPEVGLALKAPGYVEDIIELVTDPSISNVIELNLDGFDVFPYTKFGKTWLGNQVRNVDIPIPKFMQKWLGRPSPNINVGVTVPNSKSLMFDVSSLINDVTQAATGKSGIEHISNAISGEELYEESNEYSLGGRVNKYDGNSKQTNQMNYEAVNPYLKNIGIGQRPYSDFATTNNIDFYNIETGNKVNNDNANSETMVWVDPYSGIPINADRLYNDNEGNLDITSLNNDIVIRPYQGYREQMYPYHDTFRIYKVPVPSGEQDDDPLHPIIPFGDNEYFNSPQLIGEDNWTDPSENMANYALTGITGLTRSLGIKAATQLTGDLLASEVGGEAFRRINPDAVDDYPLYNLGYLANTRIVTSPMTNMLKYATNKFAYSPTNINFIRNIGNIPEVDEAGMFMISPEKNALANFTWDKSFRTHRHYKSRPGAEYMIINPESLKGERFLSTDPMDSFIPNRKLAASDVTIISGNPETRALAESRGFKTLTSDEVNKAYKNLNFEEDTGNRFNLNRFNLKRNNPFRGENSRAYDDAVNKLIHSTYGKPNILDALKLKLRTGINPHIKFSPFLKYHPSTPIEYQLGKKYNFPQHPSTEDLSIERIEDILNSLNSKPYSDGGNLKYSLGGDLKRFLKETKKSADNISNKIMNKVSYGIGSIKDYIDNTELMQKYYKDKEEEEYKKIIKVKTSVYRRE